MSPFVPWAPFSPGAQSPKTSQSQLMNGCTAKP